MALVNESARLIIPSSGKLFNGETIFNSEGDNNKCSWACHNNTTRCIENHEGLPTEVRKIVKPFHFGIIAFFKMAHQDIGCLIFYT